MSEPFLFDVFLNTVPKNTLIKTDASSQLHYDHFALSIVAVAKIMRLPPRALHFQVMSPPVAFI